MGLLCIVNQTDYQGTLLSIVVTAYSALKLIVYRIAFILIVLAAHIKLGTNS